ncbi:MAG: tail fiber domain-containing protein [Flavobacteriales bacterium]|nr:tail fiber domain-containing protein [Flavobacteriales bacterium]
MQLTVGSGNTLLGRHAGRGLTTSANNENNVIVGFNAGFNGPGSMVTATRLTLLGFDTEASDSLTNATAVGANAYVQASNSLVLGSIASTNGAGSGENTNVGIGTTTPDNRLEIVRGTGGINISGLRLTSLVGSTAAVSTGEVLSIDANGDVILVNDSLGTGGNGIGNYCTDSQNPLTGSYEVPLDTANYYFSGQLAPADSGFATAKVGIGVNCNTNLIGKLHVLQNEVSFYVPDAISVAGYFGNTTDSAQIAVSVSGITEGASFNNTGGYFEAKNAIDHNIGVEGRAVTGPTVGIVTNYGGKFEAEEGNFNFGVYASVVDTADWAGYFVGDVYSSGMFVSSDENLKQNIEALNGASDILTQLNPVSYDFRRDEYPDMQLPAGLQMGLLSQELQLVLPGLVKETTQPAQYDSSGNVISPQVDFLSVNYTGLIPLLISGIQQQQQELDTKEDRMSDLEQRLETLENCINAAGLCAAPSFRMGEEEQPTGQAVELKNINAIILDQNLPNPFAERTTISYLIPEDVREAQLIFYDTRGRIINQVEISERGQTKMTVYGENLKNGVYTYSLIADGELISTKKMVKQ